MTRATPPPTCQGQEYQGLTHLELAYLAVSTSQDPLTPTEMTEACVLYGWAPEKTHFATLEDALDRLLEAETAKGAESIFVVHPHLPPSPPLEI